LIIGRGRRGDVGFGVTFDDPELIGAGGERAGGRVFENAAGFGGFLWRGSDPTI
jgi:hypothetical protein